MKRFLMSVFFATFSLSLTFNSAQAACDQLEYNRQYQSLRSIWTNTYGNNCMNAEQFLDRFGRTIPGLSSCRINSRNAATIDFTRWVKSACVNACEQAGENLGQQLGFQVATEVCGIVAAPAERKAPVACEQRVANWCVLGLQDVLSSTCPQAFDSYQYHQAISDCQNWAQ